MVYIAARTEKRWPCVRCTAVPTDCIGELSDCRQCAMRGVCLRDSRQEQGRRILRNYFEAAVQSGRKRSNSPKYLRALRLLQGYQRGLYRRAGHPGEASDQWDIGQIFCSGSELAGEDLLDQNVIVDLACRTSQTGSW